MTAFSDATLIGWLKGAADGHDRTGNAHAAARLDAAADRLDALATENAHLREAIRQHAPDLARDLGMGVER